MGEVISIDVGKMPLKEVEKHIKDVMEENHELTSDEKIEILCDIGEAVDKRVA